MHAIAPETLGLSDGDEFALGITLCNLTLAANGPVALEHIGQTHAKHPAYAAFRLESYIGIPVEVDGVRFGTLNFSSPVPRTRSFDEIDIDALQLMSSWVGGELSRRRRVQALQSANAELEAFGRAVSHDLRTPLSAALGYVDLFVEEHGASLSQAGFEDLNRVQESIERMQTLVTGMLGLFRLSSDTLDRKPLDLAPMAERVLADLRAAHPGRAVEQTVAASLPATGDARLIRSLLDNLLGNAWKFSSSRSVISIEVGEEDREGETYFFVRDRGVGFSMDFAHEIFEPFRRLSDQVPGDGLGLATVRRIVRVHGGNIWAESQLGVGTTFYFTLG